MRGDGGREEGGRGREEGAFPTNINVTLLVSMKVKWPISGVGVERACDPYFITVVYSL